MNIRSIKMILLGLAVFTVLFAVFAIYPIFSDIREKSEELILNKKSRAELVLMQQELTSSREVPLSYPLTGVIEPLDFIEFLEKEAVVSNLSIRIISVPSRQETAWLSSNFAANLSGAPADFLTFLQKVESADYLINILSFNIIKGETEDIVQISLSGTVYGKIF